MNYWGASQCGLDECIEPLLQLVWEALKTGERTAEINYGCRGFACNHNVDIWRKTPPVRGTANYMLEPLCGVWLANELYTHYKNGALQEYGDMIRKIVEASARFAADYLVLHDGKFVICPSPSPENRFAKDGSSCYLDYASSFDMALVKQCFVNAVQISDDSELIADIEQKLPLLYPFKKAENGIAEWHTDYETPEKGHRHFSPLYGFYPGGVIGYYGDREQREWVRELFKYRLANSGQHIGWSAAWAICLAARLRDAEAAENVTRGFLCNAVFANLFCVHPPFLFQIDGNLGYVAGLNEMLVSEEDGVIELLPALPKSWDNGKVTNMTVNGEKISFVWKNNEVTEVICDKPVKLRSAHLSSDITLNGTVEII